VTAKQRGRGEADWWAAATVPGGGAADERGPSSWNIPATLGLAIVTSDSYLGS
jgi:hypothetical protein